MGRGSYLIWLVCLFLLISFVNAESSVSVYNPVEGIPPEISTGESDEWFYVQIASGNHVEYIGINKITGGEMGIADKNEFYGKIWLIPAFKHPGNSEWYVCPIKNIDTLNEVRDLNNGWYFDVEDTTTRCYMYSNPTNSISVHLEAQISFLVDDGGSTKININTTLHSGSPSDTGFAFLFFPENPAKYRYIRLNGVIYDLAGVEGQLPADKVFEFLDARQDPIGHFFDWTDMLDLGNRYSEIITVGGEKGLFVGTYGYGASNYISIDPVYNFTSSAASPSWHLLNGSLLFNQSINDYESKINITSGLSDDSDTTRYSSTIGSNIPMNFYYSFNDVGQSLVHDSSGNGNELTIQPNADISKALDIYSLECSQQSGGGAKALHKDDFNIGASDFTMGFIVNITNSTGYSKYLLRKTEYPQGFYIYADNSWRVRASFRDSNGASNNMLSTTTINDSKPHSFVIRRNITSGLIQLIVDGKVEINGTINTFGNYNNYATLEVGTISSSYGFNGFMDEIFMTETYLSDSQIEKYNKTRRLYDETKGENIQAFFNREINTSLSYSLKINKYGSGEVPVRIYPLIDFNNTNTSSYVDSTLSEGYTFVNIDSIIYDGYNCPFRVSNLHNSYEISEISLYEIGNDTIPPSIFNCFVNDSFLDCNESVALSCYVTDDSEVTEVWGIVNVVGSLHNITKQAFRNPSDPTLWEVKLTAAELRIIFEVFNWTFDSYMNVSLVYINATDLAGNTAENTSFVPPVWTIYGCILCEPEWLVNYGSCLINDSMLKYYTDNKSCNNSFGLPSDNGTYVNCNYCSADLEKDYTTECYWNDTYYVINYTWVDQNYFSCCVFTSIVEDCPTDYYPYNLSGVEYCTFTEDDFEVSYDENAYFGYGRDKVYWKIWLNDTNNTYKCLSYIKTTSGNIIQVNPVFTQKTVSFIQIIPQDYDSREVFVTYNGIANIYFTNENIVTDGRMYVFGVECSGNGQNLKSERMVNVFYESVKAPATRLMWARENLVWLTLGLILVVLLLMLLGFLINQVRSR